MQHNIVRYALRGGMAASFLVAGLMLTPAPLNAFAENELTAIEAGQSSAEEQTPEEGKTTAQAGVQKQEAAEHKAAADEDSLGVAETNQETATAQTAAKVDVQESGEGKAFANIYVSNTGKSKEDGADGSAENPFDSLDEAVKEAPNGATVHLQNDITMTRVARVIDKTLTIDGGGHTVTRGDNFETVADTERRWYNPALFELLSWKNHDKHTLTFLNITLSDDNKVEGTIYTQLDHKTTGETRDYVQDAVVASYAANDDLILGDKAVVANYGGISAVRVNSGATLTMKSGSKITDTMDITHGHSGAGNGQAGAVWNQGGNFIMEKGAVIGGTQEKPMSGRGVYLDNSGIASINGTIQNIAGSDKMWQDEVGVAVHTRAESKLVLGATGSIDGITGDYKSDGGRSAVNSTSVKEGYGLEMKQGASIKNVKNISALDLGGKNLVDGLITGCEFDTIIRVQTLAQVTIDSNALIEKNTATTGPQKAIVYTTNGSKVYMNGRIRDNDASYAFWIINQSGGGASLEMNEGALVQGKGKNTGVYINASECQFTMNGGTITGFSTGVDCRGKNGRYAKFVMNGGAITGNSSQALNFRGITNSKSVVDINGGTIENNGSSYQISASGGNSEDVQERIKIKPGVVKGNTTVYLSLGRVTLDSDYAETWLGSPKTVAKDKIKELVQTEHSDWDKFGSSALWFKPTTDKLHFTVNRPYSAKKTGLFIAYIPLKADGTPEDNAVVTIKEVNNEPTVDVSLEGLKAGTSYALMFVNNNEYTLKPDATTVYVGGSQGKDGKANGLPVLSVADSIDKINKDGLEIDGETVAGSSDKLTAKLLGMLQITYFDENGKEITDDSQSGAYTAKLAWKDKNHRVRINGNDVVGIADGSLIVRHVSDAKAAKNGENITPIAATDPTAGSDKAMAVISNRAGYYVNGNSNNKVANTDGIALMDDDALTENSGSRQQALEDKAKNVLPVLEANRAYRYDFHFLDLVDTNNGNAYVTTNYYDADVYLPYPEGTNEDTDFQLVHVKGLNREYGINGQANVDDAIAASTAEAVTTVEKTDAGIKFSMPKGDFGLYALAWKTEAHTITASVDGEGGAITPSGAVTVGTDASKTFDITPNEGYVIADVTVDGTSMGPVSRYTFEHVKEDHVIVASFRKAQHTITATAGEGGTIDPAGSVAVKDGGDQKFTITPNKGYKIADVKVDGQSVGKVASYPFAGVTADHVIEVTFEAEPVIPAHKHTWGDWQYDGKNHWHVCTVCGETADEAAHTWGDWTVVTEATETTDGLREHVCEVCGCKVQEVIPATGKKPGDKTDPSDKTDDKNKSDKKNDSKTDTKDQLPATGDASGMVAVVAAAGVAATVAGAAALRKREDR